MSEHVDTPYNLYWSARQYKEIGDKLGFDFAAEDFQQAPSENRILGVRRYMPTDDASIKLGLPPGVLVRCRLRPVLGVDSPTLDVDLKKTLSGPETILPSLVKKAANNHTNTPVAHLRVNEPTTTVVEGA